MKADSPALRAPAETLTTRAEPGLNPDLSSGTPARWGIAAMLLAASALNYIDRQTLSILAPTIQRELQLTDTDYAGIVNFFLVAYTAATLLSGWVVDRLGVRRSLALFVAWWSLANLATAFARSFTSLSFCRFALGLGEAGNWTAAPKAVAENFPARERGVAVGCYTLGATLGATLAPLLVVALVARYGWQSAFVVTGALGLLWLVPWLWFIRGCSRRFRARSNLPPPGDRASEIRWCGD